MTTTTVLWIAAVAVTVVVVGLLGVVLFSAWKRGSRAGRDDYALNVALGLPLGAGFGVALGTAFGNIALGIPIGMLFGLAIGIALGARDRD